MRLRCGGMGQDLYTSVRHQHVDSVSVEKEDKRIKNSIPGHCNIKD